MSGRILPSTSEARRVGELRQRHEFNDSGQNIACSSRIWGTTSNNPQDISRISADDELGVGLILRIFCIASRAPVLIGVPKEIKDHEGRVGLVSASVRELAAHGHRILVETDAGQGAGIFDADFERAGATIIDGGAEIWSTAELIVKVKEPLAVERKQLRAGPNSFHLPASRSRSGAGKRTYPLGRHLHRLRNRD